MRIQQNQADNKTKLDGLSSSAAEKISGRERSSEREVFESGDSIFLSGLANLVDAVKQAGSSERAEMVNQLGVAFRKGLYQPDMSALSNALIERAFEG